jgi:chromatin segregation and condensation protein Rec8/ScpA/Scc1 (kleisin family)
MTALSREQAVTREKTLLTALLLSLPGPLVTGIAAITSHSTTQLADFMRRSSELVALFLAILELCKDGRLEADFSGDDCIITASRAGKHAEA